jgi:hypothetical protein
MGHGDDSSDSTPTNAGYHGGADERQPVPNLQLPKDYWGVEGTWDEHGNWKGGKIHNPIHDVPLPASLDPAQAMPHHQQRDDPNLLPLTHDQQQHLYSVRSQLLGEIYALQQASAPTEIVQHLSTVLASANSLVHPDQWDHQLGAAAHAWSETLESDGTEAEFHEARDEIVSAASLLSGYVDHWVHQNDQIMWSTQGALALEELAASAINARQLLHH